jgi:hypothetical protein
MEWLGDDPPDEAFEIPVRLKRSHLRPSPRLDVDDPRTRHALVAFEDANLAAATLRAMLRAAERAEGARDAGHRGASSSRMADLYRFRGEAVAALHETAASHHFVGNDLVGLESSDLEPRRSYRVVTELLLESGVPERLASVRAPRADWEGFAGAAQAVLASGDACLKVGTQLERWEIAEEI